MMMSLWCHHAGQPLKLPSHDHSHWIPKLSASVWTSFDSPDHCFEILPMGWEPSADITCEYGKSRKSGRHRRSKTVKEPASHWPQTLTQSMSTARYSRVPWPWAPCHGPHSGWRTRGRRPWHPAWCSRSRCLAVTALRPLVDNRNSTNCCSAMAAQGVSPARRGRRVGSKRRRRRRKKRGEGWRRIEEEEEQEEGTTWSDPRQFISFPDFTTKWDYKFSYNQWHPQQPVTFFGGRPHHTQLQIPFLTSRICTHTHTSLSALSMIVTINGRQEPQNYTHTSLSALSMIVTINGRQEPQNCRRQQLESEGKECNSIKKLSWLMSQERMSHLRRLKHSWL